MSDEIGVKISILSDELSASEIEEFLGMKCTHSQERGQMNRLGTKPYEHHVWCFKTRCIVLPDEYIGDRISFQIDQLLSTLDKVANRFKKLSETNSVIFGLYLYAQTVPPMGLSKKQLEAITALGAELDIDLVLHDSPEIA